jgi:MFS family permease
VARKTFSNDCLRQLAVGLLDTGPRTFFLVIAVQRFSAGDLAKTLLSIPGASGMLLSVILVPFLDALAARAGRKTAVLAVSRALSAICFLLAAAFPSLEAYVFWIFLAGLPNSVAYPLLTAVYRENYPRRLRGQLFAWAAMVNTGSSILWHALIGAWLQRDIANYRAVLLGFAAASLAAAWSLSGMPSPAPRPAAADPGGGFRAGPLGQSLSAFRWIRKDRMFAYMLFVWFIFGFAVMMITPLKVLFLTEPRHGLAYPAATVALLIGILPEATRLATTAVWARLFDRYNFVGIRMAINLILLASLAAFFWGRTFPWLCVSAVTEGMMLAGGNIAWALWVTHVAPARHTAEYMAVHQFFTGVRGVIGALLGIRLASLYGMRPVAWAAVALVGLSIVLMAPARGDRRWVRAEGGTGI